MASQHRRAVGIFPNRPRTASALQALSDSGFAMGRVSIIAKDSDKEAAIAGVKVHDEETNQADTGGTVGAVTGGILGGVTGLLVGLGTLVIPGVGPALLAGEAAVVVSTLVGGAAGAAGGGLLGALIGLGIPEHRARHYRDRVAQGNYLIMLKDTEPEIARAERTLKASGIEDWDVYPDSTPLLNERQGSPNATFQGTTGQAPNSSHEYRPITAPTVQSSPPRQPVPASEGTPEDRYWQEGPPHDSNRLDP